MSIVFSIIVPAYNHAKSLPRTISSVVNQTYEKWELIIVNDASTDKTADLLNTLDDERIKVITNEENLGLDKTLMRGFATANGDFLIDLDADDALPSDALHVYAAEINDGTELVMGAVQQVDVNDYVELKTVKPVDVDNSKMVHDFLAGKHQSRGINRGALVYSKDLLMDVTRKPELYGYQADFAFVLELISKAKAKKSIDEVTYIYTIDPNGMNLGQAKNDPTNSSHRQALLNKYLSIFSGD